MIEENKNSKKTKGILEYEDELIAALDNARKSSVDGRSNEPYTVTQPEAREIFKLSRRKTKRILNKMCDAEILVRDKIGRVNNWGDYNHVPGYRLKRGA